MNQALGVVMENKGGFDIALDFYLEESGEFFEFEDMTNDLRCRFALNSEGYASFEEFVTAKGYVEEDGCKDDDKRYGFYSNPNGRMNDYTLGGRWRKSLLVKASITDYVVKGSCLIEDDYQPKETPAGYRWVDVARIKDIEWEKMKELGESPNLYALLDSEENWIEPIEEEEGEDFFKEFIEEEDEDLFLAIVNHRE